MTSFYLVLLAVYWFSIGFLGLQSCQAGFNQVFLQLDLVFLVNYRR